MKRQILLAEDDQAVLKMTKLRLEHEGFEVVVATNGEEAVRQALGHHAALILLDIRMPKLDGYEVCRQLRQAPITAKTPIIVFTGSTAQWQKLTDRCIELGITDWLKKPFRSKDLLEKVHRALGDDTSTTDDATGGV
jgi:CheY-like chemotaxis protein